MNSHVTFRYFHIVAGVALAICGSTVHAAITLVPSSPGTIARPIAATANPIGTSRQTNPNASVNNVMMQAECPAHGFVKQGAKGDLQGTHSFTCITQPRLGCSPSVNVHAYAAMPMGPRGVQFSYECFWAGVQKQQADVFAAQGCEPGFAKTPMGNQGYGAQMTATNTANKPSSTTTGPASWTGAYKCTSPLIQCPTTAPNLQHAQALTFTNVPKGVEFSYECYNVQVN